MEQMDDGIKRNSSKKKEMTIFAIFAVLVIAALLGGGYYFYSRPRAIFQESFNYLTKGLKETEQNDQLINLLTENNQVKFEGALDLSFNKDLELGMENLSLDIIAHEDKEEKVAQYKIDAKLDQKSLLEIDTYLKDNKMYVMMKEILDKYYYTNQEYGSFLENTNSEDTDIILDIISSSIKKVINDNRFKKDTVTKEIDGTEEKVTRLSLDITDKLLSEIVKEVIDQINKNDKAMNALENITGETQGSIKSILDEINNSMNDTNGETLITYNVYYKGMNQIRMLELTGDGDFLTYTANEGYRVVFKTGNEIVFDLKITNEEEVGKIDIIAGNMKIIGEVKEEDKITTATFHIHQENDEIAVVKFSEKQSSDTESVIETIIESNQKQIATLTFHTKFTFREKISTDHLKDAKDINEISIEEAQKILENVQNHEFLGSFIELFDMLNNDAGNSLDDYDDYDYNYDYDDLVS